MNSIFQNRSCLTEREVKQYLGDELSDEQRYDIENHLLDCELCSAAVEGYAQSEDFSSTEEDVEMLRSTLAASAKDPPLRRLAWINRIAAAVLFLLLAYAGFRYWDASKPERLFAAYFEPAANTYITYRSGDGPDASLPVELAQALEYYDAEKFGLSLPHFANYLGDHPDDASALLLAANAHLQAGQAERAEQYLIQLEAQGEMFEGQTAWYLALSYLRRGKMEEARERLERILADQTSPFQEKAGEVLKSME
ncbi:MAG: tetratricopeptide repeat protein [Lewinellaceae bacterium]|nr:tetratricopeptide repeat protein [Phaeodactylibacter sp.]MCB9037921.1 tetratricopeptide repeat protein [Lewinellaceae bacterium]